MSQAGSLSNGSSSPTSGNLVLLSSQVGSGQTQITFTSVITTTYDDYILIISGMRCSAATFFYCQVSSDNGANWLSTSNYTNGGTYASSGGNMSFYVGGQAQMRIMDNAGSSAGQQSGGRVRFYGISSGANMPVCTSEFQTAGGINVTNNYGNTYGVATAVNALRIYPNAGTITAGNFKLYGVVK